MPKSDKSLVVAVSRRGADRIRAGHVWVYRSDVVKAGGVTAGAVAFVQEVSDKVVRPTRASADKSVPPHHAKTGTAGNPGVCATRTLGTAFYSTASEIAIRMISRAPVEDIQGLIRERVRAAIAYRERFVRDTNAYRVIFSEGDFLPGLIVDRYNDLLSFQVLTQAMDAADMRKTFVSELRSVLDPQAIVERVDPRVRRLEQLPEKETKVIFEREPRTGETPVAPRSSLGAPDPGSGDPGLPAGQRRAFDSLAAGGRSGQAPSPQYQTESLTTEFQMNGVRFQFDPLAGQKTGAFLDQRENYAAAAQYARGEALDVFCYQGGFALHLARACEKVTGVDSSRPALEAAEQNAELNGREIEWIEGNAFDLLRDYADAGRQYDYIVLDPPAFAKSRQNRAAALRGYKELNLRALKMLRPGGILVTCSCSYHVNAADLLEVLASAAQDSHRILRLVENRRQAKDHPSVPGIPETAYLKCLILHVS